MILCLFAGIGQIFSDFPNADITAVEIDPIIAQACQIRFPHWKVVCGDAITYLQEHIDEFDIIQASPPCQTYSRLIIPTSVKSGVKIFPDGVLPSVIQFLNCWHQGKWLVENVDRSPYPIHVDHVSESVMGRHHLWSNRSLPSFSLSSMKGLKDMNLDKMRDYLGIAEDVDAYLKTKCSYSQRRQIYRNCAEKAIGKLFLQGGR